MTSLLDRVFINFIFRSLRTFLHNIPNPFPEIQLQTLAKSPPFVMPTSKHKAVTLKTPPDSPNVEKRRRKDLPLVPETYSSTLEALKDQLISCPAFQKVPTDRGFPFKPIQLKETSYRIEVCESEHINIVGPLWEHDLLEEKEVTPYLY
jgi:hypothetical protein